MDNVSLQKVNSEKIENAPHFVPPSNPPEKKIVDEILKQPMIDMELNEKLQKLTNDELKDIAEIDECAENFFYGILK